MCAVPCFGCSGLSLVYSTALYYYIEVVKKDDNGRQKSREREREREVMMTVVVGGRFDYEGEIEIEEKIIDCAFASLVRSFVCDFFVV